MRNLSVKILAVLGLALITVTGAQATVSGASATASATADIIAPIAIINISGSTLAFGQIVPVAAGTVTVATDGTRTFSGVQIVPASPTTAAQFQVTGNPNNTFSITLPASTTISSGTNNMTVDAFTSNPTSTGTLDNTGNKTLNVGGTLHVAANQAIGHYTGTFAVTVAYN